MSNQGLALLVVALLAALGLAGCTRYTCEGACSQYYGEDGCNKPSIRGTSGTQGDPLEECIRDCMVAMYTTTESAGGSDQQGYRNLESQSDAMTFINDVVERDYSDAAFNATCEDLTDTGWFQW